MPRIRAVDVVRIVAALLGRRRVGKKRRDAGDPIFALRGMGRKIWADEDADAYVDRLRSGWQ
ncbi:MAG: hypothetical protein OXI75_16325 [Rhodospirillales bacterium]|nr:hypothetical protein [Rhodospirillales bacterium]